MRARPAGRAFCLKRSFTIEFQDAAEADGSDRVAYLSDARGGLACHVVHARGRQAARSGAVSEEVEKKIWRRARAADAGEPLLRSSRAAGTGPAGCMRCDRVSADQRG